MADLTLPECLSCLVPLSCCAPEYCELAEARAGHGEWRFSGLITLSCRTRRYHERRHSISILNSLCLLKTAFGVTSLQRGGCCQARFEHAMETAFRRF